MATTCARDLMTKRFLRISTEHTLRETMGLLLYGEQKKQDTGAIAVIDREAGFAGLLTPQDVVRGLLQNWEATDREDHEQAFLRSIEKHLPRTIAEILPADQPRATADTSLAELVVMANAFGGEGIPVLVEGRVEGVVYVTDVFQAAARIALNPEADGIALEDR